MVGRLYDVGAQLALDRDVRDCLFTPFLGAGASSLRPLKVDLAKYPWREVAMTMTAIGSRLISEKSLQFMHSFAAQRLRLKSKGPQDAEPQDVLATILPPAGKPKTGPLPDSVFDGNVLLDLQVELVQAAVGLTHCFGTQFSKESPAITQLSACSVNFDVGKDEANEALMRLFDAADIARGMQKTDEISHESPFLFVHKTETRRRFEKQRVYHKLLILIVSLLGKETYLFEQRLEGHRIAGQLPVLMDCSDGISEDCGQLRLDAVQWMSELLWYTLRYWIPSYPTTAELAFELSLAVRHAPARRAELAQAAQALENEQEGQSVRIVGDLVSYCEEVQRKEIGFAREAAAFYHSIAAALQYQFEAYTEDFTARAKGRYKEKFKTGGQFAKAVPVPIAFTTNFDTALEQVFRERGLPFHMIFPISPGTDGVGEESGQVPVWMLKTWYPGGEEIDREWHEICDDNSTPKIQFEGPIIVKLHGSPSIKSSDKTLQHWLVLSEVGYLRSLAKDSPPVWLEGQLSSGDSLKGERERSLWFLGYSISDWNVRLRLYEHCKNNMGKRKNQSGGVQRSTVDRFSDIYRTAILDGLEVKQWVGDLNYLRHMLVTILMNDRIDKSAAVSALVQGASSN